MGWEVAHGQRRQTSNLNEPSLTCNKPLSFLSESLLHRSLTMKQTLNITQTLDMLHADSEGESISMDNVITSLEGRGFGPLLLAPALIAFLPSGAIPGIPSVCGILIFLVAVQRLLGKRSPWVPGRLRDVEFDRDRFKQGLDWMRPWTERVDRLFRPRLTFLFSPVMHWVVAALCVVFGLLMIPLELVPMAAAAPALAIILAAIGLSTRDGIFLMISFVFFAVTLWLAFTKLL